MATTCAPPRSAGTVTGARLWAFARNTAWRPIVSPSELGLLAAALAPANFAKSQIIFREAALSAEAHISLKGLARITCQNARLPSRQLSWNDFNAITLHSKESAFRKFHENALHQWYRLLRRSSGFLNSDVHELVGLTCSNYVPISAFKESRGPLLRASFSHQDIADWPALAAANHEHLAQFEREHLVVRQGRQLIVCVDAKLSKGFARMPSAASPATPSAAAMASPAVCAFHTAPSGFPSRVSYEPPMNASLEIARASKAWSEAIIRSLALSFRRFLRHRQRRMPHSSTPFGWTMWIDMVYLQCGHA